MTIDDAGAMGAMGVVPDGTRGNSCYAEFAL